VHFETDQRRKMAPLPFYQSIQFPSHIVIGVHRIVGDSLDSVWTVWFKFLQSTSFGPDVAHTTLSGFLAGAKTGVSLISQDGRLPGQPRQASPWAAKTGVSLGSQDWRLPGQPWWASPRAAKTGVSWDCQNGRLTGQSRRASPRAAKRGVSRGSQDGRLTG